MELFHGRPMVFIGGAAIAAALCGWYFDGCIKLVLAAAVLSAFVLCALLRIFGKLSRRHTVTLLLGFAAAFCVLLRAYAYFDLQYLSSESLCDSEHDIYMTVEERMTSGAVGTRYRVKIESIDGEAPARTTRAWLECAYSAAYRPGNRLFLRTAPVKFEKTALYDGERAALAAGVTMRLYTEDDCTVVSDRTADGVYASLSRFSSRLAFRLSDGVGGDEGALAAAMLLGRRDGLSDAVSRDFSRAGLSHLLALSGLHLSIVAGGVGWILSRLRLPRLIKTPLLTLFLLIYLALTGFPVSAVRAAIMLITLLAAYFSGADSDGVSSVFLAALLILIVSPEAIIDAGFMLSFAATFGITVFLPAFVKKRREEKPAHGKIAARARKLGSSALSLLITGLAANCFTLPVIWRMFGGISLAAPLSNMLITPLSGFFLAVSAIFIPLAGIPFFGNAAAFAVRMTARVMLTACARISELHGAVISLEYSFVPHIVIPAAAIMLILLTAKLRRPAVCLLPAAAAAAAFAVCFFASGAADPAGNIKMSLYSSKSGDTVALTSCGGTVLIDVGSGAYSALRPALDAAGAAGATETEALVLTHYQKRHISAVKRLIGREKVRRIWLPYPTDSQDTEIMAQIFDAAGRAGVGCSVYTPGEPLTCFGDVTITVAPARMLARSAQPIISFAVDAGERGGSLLYIGASAWDAEDFTLSGSPDTVIFGSRGPAIKTELKLPLPAGVRETVFTSVDAAYAAARILPDGNADKKIKLTLCPVLWKNDG